MFQASKTTRRARLRRSAIVVIAGELKPRGGNTLDSLSLLIRQTRVVRESGAVGVLMPSTPFAYFYFVSRRSQRILVGSSVDTYLRAVGRSSGAPSRWPMRRRVRP
jgi:hypothetical protein